MLDVLLNSEYSEIKELFLSDRPKRRLWFRTMNNIGEKTKVSADETKQITIVKNSGDTKKDSLSSGICKDYENEVN